ncbi:hypothetical protein JQ506_21400 [Shinella sp. PSBB067]|uniref:hypothetical protein n=1 Tax=Shinella sp. PSBB067 TaxID=2715959 RepID=UPI00193C35B4|nr:hypothetical protein [Shinella sp. PSBB067]QRI66099.1 hypothetical protein JQ506_21400 [Shinella sp. PSBB067]
MANKRLYPRKGKAMQPPLGGLPDKADHPDEPASNARPPRRKSPKWHDNLRVIDDWPERVPVTLAEVQVFERWFGDVLDEMFGGPLYTTPGENNLPDKSTAKSEQRAAQVKSTRSRNRR